jgi:hypothetical protein
MVWMRMYKVHTIGDLLSLLPGHLHVLPAVPEKSRFRRCSPTAVSLASIYLFDIRLADLHLFESHNNSASSTTCESNDRKLQALHEHPS